MHDVGQLPIEDLGDPLGLVAYSSVTTSHGSEPFPVTGRDVL
jgi:hypothetical protein